MAIIERTCSINRRIEEQVYYRPGTKDKTPLSEKYSSINPRLKISIWEKICITKFLRTEIFTDNSFFLRIRRNLVTIPLDLVMPIP